MEFYQAAVSTETPKFGSRPEVYLRMIGKSLQCNTDDAFNNTGVGVQCTYIKYAQAAKHNIIILIVSMKPETQILTTRRQQQYILISTYKTS